MKFEELNRIIKEIEYNQNSNVNDILSSTINPLRNHKAILGFDIYHYSEHKFPKQDIIPYIFESILRESCTFATTYDSFIYQKYNAELYKNLISTGDGGFMPFDNPLEALIFLLYFNLNLKYFNSFHKMKKIREYIGPISIRFCITYDYIFEYEENLFGAAIINNARIMSGDKLNRLLIDKNTHDWFEKFTFGLENLPNVKIESLKNMGLYNNFSDPLKNPWFINDLDTQKSLPEIRSVDVLKMGESEIKKNKLDTYNVIVTYSAKVFKEIEIQDTDLFNLIILNLGNYNTSGL